MQMPRSAHPWVLLLATDVAVPAVTAWKYHAGEASTNVALTSACLSLLILNALIALGIRARNKKLGLATPRRFYAGATCFAAISGLLTVLAVHSIPVRNDYLDVALSDTPLDEIQPKQKALVVELARRNAADSKTYERVASESKPISPALYSPASFENESVIRSVSQKYQKAYDIDLTYRMQIERNKRKFHDEMSKIDPAYLKSFEEASKERNKQDDRAFQLEHQCVTTTLALYDYAATHSRDIKSKDGKLDFANENVRVEFSQRLEECKSLYQHWQDALQELIRKRQESRKALGISPSARSRP